MPRFFWKFPLKEPVKKSTFSYSPIFLGWTNSCVSNSKFSKIEETECSRRIPGSNRHVGNDNWNKSVIFLKITVNRYSSVTILGRRDWVIKKLRKMTLQVKWYKIVKWLKRYKIERIPLEWREKGQFHRFRRGRRSSRSLCEVLCDVLRASDRSSNFLNLIPQTKFPRFFERTF